MKKEILVLVLLVTICSGCAMCSKDPVLGGRDRGKTDPLTAIDRCIQKAAW